MATRVDLPLEATRNALNKEIASLKRAINNTPNKLVTEIYQKELAQLQTAINTLTETK